MVMSWCRCSFFYPSPFAFFVLSFLLSHLSPFPGYFIPQAHLIISSDTIPRCLLFNQGSRERVNVSYMSTVSNRNT
jgi:hypothetical protein